MTYDRAAAKKDKAERFVRDVLGDDDRADEIGDESVESYAERKHYKIENPDWRVRTMATTDTSTKADLQDAIDSAVEILQAAYVPEADRETLACAVGDALAALEGDLDEDDSGDDDEDSDFVDDDAA
jgi:hypothetical protein